MIPRCHRKLAQYRLFRLLHLLDGRGHLPIPDRWSDPPKNRFLWVLSMKTTCNILQYRFCLYSLFLFPISGSVPSVSQYGIRSEIVGRRMSTQNVYPQRADQKIVQTYIIQPNALCQLQYAVSNQFCTQHCQQCLQICVLNPLHLLFSCIMYWIVYSLFLLCQYLLKYCEVLKGTVARDCFTSVFFMN